MNTLRFGKLIIRVPVSLYLGIVILDSDDPAVTGGGIVLHGLDVQGLDGEWVHHPDVDPSLLEAAVAKYKRALNEAALPIPSPLEAAPAAIAVPRAEPPTSEGEPPPAAAAGVRPGRSALRSRHTAYLAGSNDGCGSNSIGLGRAAAAWWGVFFGRHDAWKYDEKHDEQPLFDMFRE